MKNLLVFASGSLFLLASTESAFAYLDPGTGSMVLQAILGGAAVALATGSLYVQKIKSFFGARRSADKRDDSRKNG